MPKTLTDAGPSAVPPHVAGGGKRGSSKQRYVTSLTPYMLVAPAVILIGVMLLYPMSRTLLLSFQEVPFGNTDQRQWIGLSNYTSIFADEVFRRSVMFTAVFTISAIVLELLIAFPAAFALDKIRRGRSTIATLILLPFMVATIAVGLIWRLILLREYGVANWFIELLGFERLGWVADPSLATVAAILAEAWSTMPFVMLILLAGLTQIPQDLLEAARTDGANEFKSAFYITLPLLAPSITVALVFQTVLKIRVFDLIFLLTEGGPGNQTTPLGLLIHRYFFRYFETGEAAAVSVILLMGGAAICAGYVRLLYREIEY